MFTTPISKLYTEIYSVESPWWCDAICQESLTTLLVHYFLQLIKSLEHKGRIKWSLMAFIFWKIWQERIWLGWGRKKLWWNCPDIISPPIQGQPGQFRSCADFCVPAKQNYPIDRHSSFIHCSMEMPAYKKGQTNLGCSLYTIMSIHDHVINSVIFSILST